MFSSVPYTKLMLVLLFYSTCGIAWTFRSYLKMLAVMVDY